MSRVESAPPQGRPLRPHRRASLARYLAVARRIGTLAVTAAAVGLVACARSARPEPSPSHPTSVTLTYLGAAGWRIDTRQHVLLVDPYFSRVDAEGGAPLAPNPEFIAKYAPARADAILVGHSHYDHLLDVPGIAQKSGAVIVGTPSTLNVARAAGVAEARLIDVTASENSWSAGPWSVKAVRGLHSLIGKPSLTIPPAVTLPMNVDGYAEGGVLDYVVTVEGRTLLFIGSANFIEAELRGVRPDVAVVATALRDKIPDYTCRLMRALDSPPLVLANHFDAHWEPLGPKQLDIGEKGYADLTKFADEVRQCSPATRVVVPKHFDPMTTFWLDGSLRISPEEQARFMVRLCQDALPVDKRALRTVREILIQPAGMVVNATGAHPFAAPWPEGTVVSAKTGRGVETRWIVGHVARANRSWVFVSAVVEAPEANPLAAIDLAAASLRSAGVL